MADAPDHLRRFLPERPEPTPEEQFNAYLAGQAASRASARPRRQQRVVVNLLLLAVGLATWAPFGWLLVQAVWL